MAATAPTAEVRSATPGPPEATARRVPAPRAATLLLGVLLAALAYGAFAHGAAQIPEENRLQVALAVVATLACGAWLFVLAWHGCGLVLVLHCRWRSEARSMLISGTARRIGELRGLAGSWYPGNWIPIQ